MKHHSVPKKVQQSKSYNTTNFYGIQAILPKCEMCKAEVLPEAGLCKAHAHCQHTIKTSITQQHYAANIADIYIYIGIYIFFIIQFQRFHKNNCKKK